jgi:hypothetical protein
VLHEQLRNAWQVRKRLMPISPVLNLTPEGLALGAGTVLVPADGPRQLQSLRGQEARVLALLSVAYGRAVAPSVLGNIERAAKAWHEGDDCLAYIHLAHTGLRELQDRYELARRLFIVDGFMKAGPVRAPSSMLSVLARHTPTRSRSSTTRKSPAYQRATRSVDAAFVMDWRTRRGAARGAWRVCFAGSRSVWRRRSCIRALVYPVA